jgi:trimeric autotransporter adhesin
LQITATEPDGTTVNVTAQAAFTTSNAKVATVDSTGTVIAVAPGIAVITAQYKALVATLNVTVGLTLESIAATPAPVVLAQGATQQLKITAAFNDRSMQDVTASATYASSSTAVATVSAAGLVTAVSAGSATITASYQGQTVTAQITVSAATLSSIAVTSSANSLAPGATAQLTTTVKYSDGSTQALTSGVTFTSDNPTVATVSAAGLVTAVAAGNANMTASYQGQTAAVQISVTASTSSTLSSIAVSSSATSLAPGATAQLTTTGTYSNGSTRPV